MKESKLSDWEEFWARKQDVDNVYDGVTNPLDELGPLVDFKDQKILEVGAGTGRDSFRLAEQGACLFVLDYSENSLSIINKLKNETGKHIILIRADANFLPLKNNCMDIVFHRGLLEHFRNPDPILAENHRVLCQEGLLCFDVPQTLHLWTLIKKALIFFNKWFAGWETQYFIGRLKKLVCKHGFVVKKTFGDWMYPSIGYRIFREILMKLRIKLPRDGFRIPVLASWRRKFKLWFRNKGPAFYTFNAIGIVAKKQ